MIDILFQYGMTGDRVVAATDLTETIRELCQRKPKPGESQEVKLGIIKGLRRERATMGRIGGENKV